MRSVFLIITLIYFGSAQSRRVSFNEAARSAASSKNQVLEDYLELNHPDAGTYYGMTLLRWAAAGGNSAGISLLLAAGSDVNAKSDSGETVLIEAAWNGWTESVRALLSAQSIDINIQDNAGNTALGVAENDEIKKMLEDRNAMCRCVSDVCRKWRNNC